MKVPFGSPDRFPFRFGFGYSDSIVSCGTFSGLNWSDWGDWGDWEGLAVSVVSGGSLVVSFGLRRDRDCVSVAVSVVASGSLVVDWLRGVTWASVRPGSLGSLLRVVKLTSIIVPFKTSLNITWLRIAG